jgi:hypothetical protein
MANPKEFEEIKKLLQKRLADSITKSISLQAEALKLQGKSPIEQAKDFIKKHAKTKPVKACVCCKHWTIVSDKTSLMGTCEKKSGEKTDYGFVCDAYEHWII